MKRVLLSASTLALALLVAVGSLSFSARAFGQDQTIEVGRELMDDNVKGATPDVSTGSFTVASRVKIFAPGKEKGNGDELGMIYCVASGWTEGFRAYYDWRTKRFTFQIGRQGGSNGCTSDFGYLPGVMRDVVTVCDAQSKRLTLYVDGKAVAGCDHVCALDTRDMPLVVGFAGMGVGSNRMYVDKVEYWKRALTAEEIAARNAKRSAKELAEVEAIDRIAASSKNAANVGELEALRDALKLDLPEDAKIAIKNDVREQLLFAGKYEEAAPLVREAVEAYLQAAPDPKSLEGTEPTNAELALFGKFWYEAQAVKSLKDLLEKLRAAYPREAKTYDKIQALEDSAERVRALEQDAFREYEATRKTLDSLAKRRAIYLAPNGDDQNNDGSQARPFASVARAFDEIMKAPEAAYDVLLAEGEYRVDRVAKLQGANNVRVRPAAGAKVALTGGRRVANFKRLTDAAKSSKKLGAYLERFSKEARPNIYVADLKDAGVVNCGKLANRGYGAGDNVAPIPSLYVDGESQTLARWPNQGDETLKFGAKVDKGDVDTSTFKYDYDRPNNWKDLNDVWAFGLYEWEWAANLRRVVSIDREKKEVEFDYLRGSGKFDYYFVNVLEELDAQGEYFVDAQAKLLFYYPELGAGESENALNTRNVEFDEFEELFFDLVDSQNVVFEGIDVRCGRNTCFSFKNCEHCYFVNGAIEQIGGNAGTINQGRCCGLFGSRLRELGAGGLRISGGDRETLTPCLHMMWNNKVADFSRIDRVYTPALHADGCGAVVTNNLFFDSPHHAMRTDGNDIYVARNEVHSVVYEYSDQSGIDIFCDPSYRGIVIEKNFFHHIGSAFALCGQAGIRLDDSISGVVMLNNVFYRSSGGFFGGIQIHGGKDNLCRGNLFVDCKQAFSFSPWQVGRYEEFVKERFPQHVGKKEYLERYPFFDEIFQNYNRNYVLENDAINCGRFNQNGDSQDLFAGNRNFKATPDLKALGMKEQQDYQEAFLTNVPKLRKWLAQFSKVPLDDIGLVAPWEESRDRISVHFTGVK